MILKSLSRIFLLLTIALLSFCSSNNSPIIETQYLKIEFNDSLYSKITSTLGNESVILNDYSATEYVVVMVKRSRTFILKNMKKQIWETPLEWGRNS